MSTSGIEWTERTLNPWTGCTKVSPGCANCYIARTPPFRIAKRRFERGAIPLEFHLERLDAMVKRRKPTMYFVNSLSDVFHEDVPVGDIARLFGAMAAAPQHTFQILTKRPERMVSLLSRRVFPAIAASASPPSTMLPIEWPLPNVWLGTSIENRRFVHRANLLRDTPAAVRFISAEPLLGPLLCDDFTDGDGHPATMGTCWYDGADLPELDLTGIDWLIVGGESGPGHRQLNLDWVRKLRNEAAWKDTALFVKQLGGARPGTALDDLPEDLRIRQFPTQRPQEVTSGS